jgi:hypothetical protein
MNKIATAVLGAIALVGPAPAFAGGKPADSRRALPSSYAPTPHNGPHVYGSPIETGGVSRAQAPRNEPASEKQLAKPQKRDARHHKTQSRRSPAGSRPSPG